ncbi:MAG: ABC transporter permease [Ilumatobacteraceae bacterium]|jgi:peptide/nickel transport system permease protein|nr:ABC transporter permease [Ilumatobacteraceae bacterium]
MRFWLQRVAMAVLLLLSVSALTFGAMNILGDPLFNILGPVAGDVNNPDSVKLIEKAKAEFDLDEPLVVRYGLWLSDFVRGDMGVQFSSDGQPPVSDLIKERLPRTATLVLLAQLMAISIAIPWALVTASRAGRLSDRISTMNTFFLVAMPNFALAIILKFVLSIKLGWMPLTYVANDPLSSRLWQMVLPALTIALPVAAVFQRLLRTDLITTLQQDFILMARAKGLSRRRVLFRHALRPSLFSFITVVGLNTGALIGGSIVVETIFRIPGIGSSLVESVLREDFPVVLAIVMIVAVAFVLINLLVDILYSIIDPRVRR